MDYKFRKQFAFRDGEAGVFCDVESGNCFYRFFFNLCERNIKSNQKVPVSYHTNGEKKT